jgi:hypothetical protein
MYKAIGFQYVALYPYTGIAAIECCLECLLHGHILFMLLLGRYWLKNSDMATTRAAMPWVRLGREIILSGTMRGNGYRLWRQCYCQHKACKLGIERAVRPLYWRGIVSLSRE